MKYNTGLYIRRRDSGELWQLFLGGYTKTKPSELCDSYRKHFWELSKDYEWVVLERRMGSRGSNAMYRVGDSERVDVMIDNEELVDFVPDPRYDPKMVECLSIWHDEQPEKMFKGSISNRICPDCIEREYHYFYDMEKNDRTERENETC